MSVKVHNRKTSGVQFIDTARDLLVHTINSCKKFPKSVMFYLTQDLVMRAREVYANVVKANSIYPKGEVDIELRYHFLVEARGNIDVLSGLLGIVKSIYGVNLKNMLFEGG